MGWIITLVIGGIIGWVASMIMKTNAQMGMIANVLVGVVGSSLGFWLAGLLKVGEPGTVMSYIIAVIGAAILIGLLKAVKILK
ncbi:MAG: GlsB/YeaQ/YmgE family stress response membrane protein [Acidobacteria bacterium]|jgi:uncharacterized membrane protein YeaQ/YmgE (transglycosylase-associated protein family)|nr:GlsB/YeaQ/YmgE family stress response membrane protein [Acidobacteriota bacterium]